MTLNTRTRMLWMLLMICCSTAFSNNKKEFGKDWEAAEKYISDYHDNWKEEIDFFQVDVCVAEAVVFPELIRYSMWQDEIEKAAVNALYISGGKEKANFSIGRFQMKPSFAEDVERDWNNSNLAKEYNFVFNTQDNVEARRSRVKRLSDKIGQCRYLAIFLRLQYERNKWLQDASQKEQVRYLATAYNHSHTAPKEVIKKMQRKKSFYTTIIKTKSTKLYNYSDIAVEYFLSK